MTHITTIVNSDSDGPYTKRASGKSTVALAFVKAARGSFILFDEGNQVYRNDERAQKLSLDMALNSCRGKRFDHLIVVRPSYAEAQEVINKMAPLLREVETNTLIEFTHINSRTFG